MAKVPILGPVRARAETCIALSSWSFGGIVEYWSREGKIGAFGGNMEVLLEKSGERRVIYKAL